MSVLRHKIAHEFRELIPVTLFFFVAFQLLALTQALILREYGISVSTFLAATLMAMIVAKVVVLTDHFRFVNRYPEKPLIYNVVWKTTIYFLVSLVVRYAEHLIHAWRKSSSFSEANHLLLKETIWPHFWAVQLWFLVLLFVYCSLRELIRALGRQRVIAMFFTDPVRNPSLE